MNRIKLSGIYIIKHAPSGRFYIGMSTDIFGRWGSHYGTIKMAQHTSVELARLWLATDITEWSFSVLEAHSITKYKKDEGLKGKEADAAFRKFLFTREKEVMSLYPKSLALNKDNKRFKD